MFYDGESDLGAGMEKVKQKQMDANEREKEEKNE